MRIIAGLAKGRKLLPPDGADVTRPTLDRVKEAMFSMIQNKIPNAEVLDVFAGTGSLGLESVSRGANHCFLVDRNPITFERLMKNVSNIGFENNCNCLNMDSYEALSFLSKKEKVFDIIFIDPPYLKDMIPKAIEMICSGRILHDHGIIVTKIDSSEEIYEGNGEIQLKKHRKYGNTTVCLYEHTTRTY
ncbi:MAG: 16S rRNA (guanine(966)-N(2))-methyltransferase RsmD [Clostridia bacterium]|jgi:16S rRNA (guanine966-N2)-methyltransferase|nr:16S rRNA (guanine(966)-N(2))-methyltransferase RsmD [Clostridia bacterium]